MLEKGEGQLFRVWVRKEKHEEGGRRQGRAGCESSGLKKRFRDQAAAWERKGPGNGQHWVASRSLTKLSLAFLMS